MSDLISRSEAEKLGATCLARRNENGQLEAIINLDNVPSVEPKMAIIPPEVITKLADSVVEIISDPPGQEEES